jgi:hypothetical protein
MYSRSEEKELKKNFWQSFGNYCELQPAMRKNKRHWILYNTKIRGLELKFDVTRNGAYVILELNDKDEDRRLEMYEKLQSCRLILQEKMGDNELFWDLIHEKPLGEQVSRVYVCQKGIDFHRTSDWGVFFQFMYKNMLTMEQFFKEIREIFIEE